MITDVLVQRWGHDRSFDGVHTLWVEMTWPWEEFWPENDGSGVWFWLTGERPGGPRG